MVADIRWITVLCVMYQLCHVDGRVIDNDDHLLFEDVVEEDPYNEEPFEEDRYETLRAKDQVTTSTGPQLQARKPLSESDRQYRECSSPSDCFPDECCLVGLQRFSEPSCRRLGSEGDFCRVDQEPVNRTLYYPNGESKEVTNGHFLFCPCADGLTCLRAHCRPNREVYLEDKSHKNTL